MNHEYSAQQSSPLGVYQASTRLDTLWLLGLLLAALFLFGIDLGGIPLRDWDEGTHAQVARDLWRFSSGFWNWLYPTQGGMPYLNKPPLMHWLMASTYYWGGGPSEWTARLPSAVLTALSVPLLYSLARELFPRRSPAVFSALIYLTLLPVVRHGRLAMLDGAILCFSILMLLGVLRARRDLRWTLVAGIGFGLICLTKGILGILLGAIAVVFLVCDTPRLLKSPYLWVGIALGSLPVVFWYVAQWQYYQSRFVQDAVMAQSLNRIWSGVENNTGPPWYYLLEISKVSWPWIVFWPVGLHYAWKHRNLSWAKFSLIWVGGFLCVISLMQTKLPWYVLPLYPPLALIGGIQLARLWRNDFTGMPQEAYSPYPQRWFITFTVLSLVAWCGMAYYRWGGFASSIELQGTLLVFALTLSIVTVLIYAQDALFLAVLIWGTYLALTLLMQSDEWVWELRETYPVKPVAEIVRHGTPPKTIVYTSYPDARPSLDFYSDRLVLPATPSQLKNYWQQPKSMYLLLDSQTLDLLQLKRSQFDILGHTDVKFHNRMQTWLLITQQAQTLTQPTPEHT
jgi:4-amino-4-deoxy-L-arabinose transferase-like glycosyltransferase